MQISLISSDERPTIVNAEINADDLNNPPVVYIAEILYSFQDNPDIFNQLKKIISDNFGDAIYMEAVSLIQKAILPSLLASINAMEGDFKKVPLAEVIRLK